MGLGRLGKRVVVALEGELFLVFHLMIAGRFRWKVAGAKIPGKVGLLALDFANGTLVLTEAGTKRQASLHVVEGHGALAAHDPGGIDVMGCTLPEFAAALRRERHTLKRSLTDPHLFSGIGNAYSDEILHAARLSPFKLTSAITDGEIAHLLDATRSTLAGWTSRLREEAGDAFPEKVTAFRDGMAVHGRYGHPCPACGTPVQRIVYAANEANYCPTCQTGGRLLADRALSRLLREDWPRTLEELERRKAAGGTGHGGRGTK
jgi:formamidopyrimidine-DNA glycosylase